MAYQQVGTPKFFINDVLFNITNGINVIPADMYHQDSPAIATGDKFDPNFYLNPSAAPTIIPANHLVTAIVPINYHFNYIMYLGHDFASNNIKAWITYDGNMKITGDEGNVNMPSDSTGASPQFDGWSLHLFEERTNVIPLDQTAEGVLAVKFDNPSDTNAKINAISMGFAYTMPHSPDLNLTLSYDYGGIKTIETRGGASLSNSFYSKPPMWGDLGAWELHKEGMLTGEADDPDTLDIHESENVIRKSNQNLRRNGRKIWDLSFSYLSQEDTFPRYDQLTTLETDDAADLSPDQYTIQGSNDFYSEVVKRTNGGQLPFIFQPNSEENSFAICKFDSGFSFEQVANGVYNVKMKIREVW